MKELLFSVLILFTLVFLSIPRKVLIHKTTIENINIPKGFHDYKILFLSDLHINNLLPKRYFKKIVQKINGINPDLILLGGDYIDDNTVDYEFVSQILGSLKQFTVIGVTGNHDHGKNDENINQKLIDSGIILLENDNYPVKKNDDYIIISGISDYMTSEINIEKSLSQTHENDFVILVSHSPEPYAEIRNNKKVDLMLSGHTHGGQVTLFGLWAPVLPLKDRTYWRGDYQSEENELIVTNGIGVFRFPFRIFANPKMELIKLSSINNTD